MGHCGTLQGKRWETKKKKIFLTLLQDYDRLRPLSYPQTDVFLVAFSIVSPTSFANVSAKWLPELQHYCPDARIVLCGLKSDLRADGAANQVPAEKATQLVKQNGLYAYMECSALTSQNLTNTFDTVIRAGLEQSKGQAQSSKKKAGGGFFGSLFSRDSSSTSAVEADPAPMPPVMPKGVPAPFIYPADSRIAVDFKKLFEDQNPSFANVEFHVASGNSVLAHSLILTASSPLFEELLNGSRAPSNPFVSLEKLDGKVHIRCVETVTLTILKRVLGFGEQKIGDEFRGDKMFQVSLFRRMRYSKQGRPSCRDDGNGRALAT